MSGIREATESDYLKIQGGKPEIRQEGELTVVDHNYDPKRGEVRSHREVDDFGEVVLEIDGQQVEFKAACLWFLHGQPCETRSRELGGEGYSRKGDSSER